VGFSVVVVILMLSVWTVPLAVRVKLTAVLPAVLSDRLGTELGLSDDA
jgi:hypothetical protein